MTKPLLGRLVGLPQPAGRRPYLRRAVGLGLAGVGLAALAACGSATPSNTAATASAGGSSSSAAPTTTSPTTTSDTAPWPGQNLPTPPPPTSTDTATPKATGPTVPPSQIDYSAAPENVPQTVWQQDGGKTLVVMAEEGGCVKVDAQVTKQTSTEVDVTLLSTAQTHRICPLYVRNIPVAAHLDAPLGSRKVVLTTQTGTQH